MENPEEGPHGAIKDYPTERGEMPGETPAEEEAFLDSLKRLHGDAFRIPVVAGAPLEVARLYREMNKRGGFVEVVANKKMSEIARAMGLFGRHTAPSHICKHHYEWLLYPYEDQFVRGHKPPAPAQKPAPNRSRSTSKADLTQTTVLQEKLGDAAPVPNFPPMTSVHPVQPLQQSSSGGPPVVLAEAPSLARQDSAASSAFRLESRAASADIGEARDIQASRSAAQKRRRLVTNMPVPPAPVLNEQQKREAQIQEVQMIKGKLQPFPGPVLVVDGLPESLSQVASCLQSRKPEAMAWALNVLGVASKQKFSELQLQKDDPILEHLLTIMEEGMMDIPPTKRSLAQEEQIVQTVEPKRRPPTKGLAIDDSAFFVDECKPEDVSPVPWWEAEEGLFADDDASTDAGLWGICASNILCNLSVGKTNRPNLSTERCLLVYTKSLQYHLENVTSGTAELANNCLGILQHASGHVNLATLKPDDSAGLLSAVVGCVADLWSVSRLRSQAAHTLAGLAENEGNHDILGVCIQSSGTVLVQPLLNLLEAPCPVYAAEIKDGRDAEGPGAFEAHITYLSESSREICGYRLWGQAQLAATTALARLCCAGDAAAKAVADTPRVVPALVNIMLCRQHSSFTAGLDAHASGSSKGLSHAFPSVMRGFRHLAGRIRWESTVALAALASLKEVPSALMAAEMDIAEACMSPGCDERMVQVLAILARA